ncbi:MAG TPA: barstar family protein [Casimicrobiaceae bacterium]|jgi:RNAse (barnase) inhibitor barstar
MKPPDLTAIDDAGVHPWGGAPDALKSAATHAHLRFASVDLSKAHDRATLFAEIDGALKLPEHFGHNWDALADVLEDRDWLGRHGIVVALSHSASYKRNHPTEWGTLEDILAEAAEFWKERHAAFWVFVS